MSTALIRVFFKAAFFTITAGAAWAVALDASAKQHYHAGKPVPNWYLALSSGINFITDSDVTTAGGVAPVSGEIDFKEGYRLGVAVGYKARGYGNIADHLRYELELGYLDNELSSFENNGSFSALEGDIHIATGMVNMYIDLFDNHSPWRPYIGGGVGLAQVSLEETLLGLDGEDDDTVFAYQGMAGVYYKPPAWEFTEVGIGYRYFGMNDPDFVNTGANSTITTEYDSHLIEAGMRFYF